MRSITVVIFATICYTAYGNPDKSRAIGPCQQDGSCLEGNLCVNNECYPEETVLTRARRSSKLDGLPKLTTIGSCSLSNGLCPMNYECIQNVCHRLVTTNKTPIGPCVNKRCPDNYYCNSADYKCYP